MERVNRILKHEQYIEYLKRIEAMEQDRAFCKHDLSHFLDVCRLACLLYLENKEYESGFLDSVSDNLHKELIYAAGLLHDIGRWKQYEDGTPHERASEEIAPDILRDCGFLPEETAVICEAIGNHRNSTVREEKNLSGLLYRADKMSRPCFGCKREAVCNWDGTKKNRELIL